MLRFPCPACGAFLSAPEEVAGRTSRCRCGQAVTVPSAPLLEPTVPPEPAKTAMGRIIAHQATSLGIPPEAPLKDTLPAKKAPPLTSDKTVLGEAITHRPTSLGSAVTTAALKN